MEIELITKVSDASLQKQTPGSILQDFTRMHRYLNQSTWSKANQAAETGSEFGVLRDDLAALGLRNCSCPAALVLRMISKRLIAGNDAFFLL